MPVMDGLTSTKLIRNSNHLQAKTIPIIALTANMIMQEKQNAFKYNINGFVIKPIDINELFIILAKYL